MAWPNRTGVGEALLHLPQPSQPSCRSWSRQSPSSVEVLAPQIPLKKTAIQKHTLVRTMAEISWGVNDLVSPRYSTSTLGLSLPSSMTLKGQASRSFLTMGSLNGRPMRRLEAASQQAASASHAPVPHHKGTTIASTATYLTSKMVLAAFMAAWFLAASPIRRSLSVKETKDGVVKLPCSLAIISTLAPS